MWATTYIDAGVGWNSYVSYLSELTQENYPKETTPAEAYSYSCTFDTNNKSFGKACQTYQAASLSLGPQQGSKTIIVTSSSVGGQIPANTDYTRNTYEIYPDQEHEFYYEYKSANSSYVVLSEMCITKDSPATYQNTPPAGGTTETQTIEMWNLPYEFSTYSWKVLENGLTVKNTDDPDEPFGKKTQIIGPRIEIGIVGQDAVRHYYQTSKNVIQHVPFVKTTYQLDDNGNIAYDSDSQPITLQYSFGYSTRVRVDYVMTSASVQGIYRPPYDHTYTLDFGPARCEVYQEMRPIGVLGFGMPDMAKLATGNIYAVAFKSSLVSQSGQLEPEWKLNLAPENLQCGFVRVTGQASVVVKDNCYKFGDQYGTTKWHTPESDTFTTKASIAATYKKYIESASSFSKAYATWAVYVDTNLTRKNDLEIPAWAIQTSGYYGYDLFYWFPQYSNPNYLSSRAESSLTQVFDYDDTIERTMTLYAGKYTLYNSAASQTTTIRQYSSAITIPPAPVNNFNVIGENVFIKDEREVWNVQYENAYVFATQYKDHYDHFIGNEPQIRSVYDSDCVLNEAFIEYDSSCG